MKKKLSLLLTAALAASAVMTGCGGSDNSASEPQTIDDIQSEEADGEESTAAGSWLMHRSSPSF